MDHVITAGDVFKVIGVFAGIFLIGGGCIFILSLLNPFRSGH